MKDIRIFIASSKELNQERNELAFLVLAKEEEFAQRGLRVRLAKWEYVDPKMTAGRTEDRYLDEMYNCDAAMVIFKNIAGMYTREELDKALAREAAGSDRIKTHKILFSAEGKPDSDAAKLRSSLSADCYGIYENSEGLQKEFLAIVDHLVEMDRSGTSGKMLLEAVPDAHVRRITAFLAADEELMADRNAFADTVLNLNDLLEFRNLRVQLRFCGAGLPKAKMQELVASSEMGLVLYGTNIRAFGHEEMDSAYNRTCCGENPKKLYVFFRDEEGKDLSSEFKEFRNSFIDKLGHFVCQFGGPDSLRLAFLLSLERYAGETVEVYSTVTPPTASVFVGRETELRQLTDLLTVTPTFPAGRLPIVTGAGGTGKSELVRQYASQLRVQYPGGVFQVDMETRRTWDDVFLGMLAVKSNGGGNNGVDIFECLGLKKEEAQKTTGADVRNALLKRARDCGPVLLVLDNLEHCEGLVGENAFVEAFPAGFSERVSVNVIATARTCDAPLSKNDWAQVFPLGDLSPESALELLFANKCAESEAEVRAAKRVAELLGYRALFLRRVPMILNGVNKKSRIVCRNYTTLARVLEEDPLLTISRTATVDETHLPSRLWELVRNNLSEWGLGEACIKLIEIASFFSPDGFPQHILRHLWKELVFMGLEDWGTEEEVFDQVVDLATNYNIFQSTDPVRIHRLDRAAIQVTAKETAQLAESVGRILAAYPAMRAKDWLTLSDQAEILAYIPECQVSSDLYAKIILANAKFPSDHPEVLKYIESADWVKVLGGQPTLDALCPWDSLSGEDWSNLLIARPDLQSSCPWRKLNGRNWVKLLSAHPEFEAECAWDKIPNRGWMALLEKQPKFASKCPWNLLSTGSPVYGEKLYQGDWVDLLVTQPQFADKCPLWSGFGYGNAYDLLRLLKAQPKFFDMCPGKDEYFEGRHWVYLICSWPQFAEHCPWSKMTGQLWAALLSERPQFADRCNWELLDGKNWVTILRKQPQFEDRCSWEKLDGGNWQELLSERPQFSGLCEWDKLDGGDWCRLLSVQPQFSNVCDWSKLSGSDWSLLVMQCPQFADKCEWSKIEMGRDWWSLLASQPQFAKHCNWSLLNPDQWRRLLVERPEFYQVCDWSRFSGSDWEWVLSDLPQLSQFCPWEKLNEDDWWRLLKYQPHFIRFCEWEKFSGETWIRIFKNAYQDGGNQWHRNEPRLAGFEFPFTKEIATKIDQALTMENGFWTATCCIGWERDFCETYLPCDNVCFWASLLARFPRYAQYCNSWNRFDGWSTCLLLSEQPQLNCYFDLKNLADPVSDCWIQPEFVRRFEYYGDSVESHSKPNYELAWKVLVEAQPQFATYVQYPLRNS